MQENEATMLIRELTSALADLGNWLAYGIERPDGPEVTAEEERRCQEVAEKAGEAVAKGYRYLGMLGSCDFPSRISTALNAEKDLPLNYHCPAPTGTYHDRLKSAMRPLTEDVSNGE